MLEDFGLSTFKSQFFKSDLIHLNNAGLAPISLIAMERIKYWGDRFYKEGFYTDHDYMEEVKECRKRLAGILGSESESIAFFQNTSSAISQVAFEFPFSPGDEIVIWETEYSSNLYPWFELQRRNNCKLKMVSHNPDYSTPFESLVAATTSNTKLIAVSWAQFQTGSYTDIEKLGKFCDSRGIFLLVDVMQALGLRKFKMTDWKVDAVVGGSHKWLVSPVGVGFLALNKKHFSTIRPHNVGSGTYGSCDDPAALDCLPKQDASKYESGSKQVLEITALGESLKLLESVDLSKIEGEALRLSRILSEGLLGLGAEVYTPLNPEHPIVNFSFNKRGKSLTDTAQTLKEVNCNYALRGPGLRLSPHAFNTELEINRVLDALKSSFPRKR